MQRPLLILDIDETLIHSSEERLGRDADFRVEQYFVYIRPHMKLFLESVCSEYAVACWSSATEDYLDEVLGEIMKNVPKTFVWGRSRCTRKFDFERQEVYFVKDLKKIKRRGFDLERVLILEDEPRKVERSFGNAIYVKPFTGEDDDNELPKLASYLISIHSTEKFRSLDKRHWRKQAVPTDE